MRIKALIVIGAATVGVAAPAFAQIPVPTVQAPVPVPTVQVPVPVPTVRVPVPTVQAPIPVPTVKAPVPVPTVKAPVPVPTVKAPVPVPTVRVPDVPVPAVPGVTAPTGGGSGASGGSGGSAGSSGGSSSGSNSGASSGGSASGGGSSGGGSSSNSAGDSSAAGAGSSSAATPGSAASRSATSRASAARAAASRAGGSSSRGTKKSPAALCRGQVKGAKRRDCELRETVAQTSRCLDDLSAGQRRVLTLRAGVGAGPPRSRGGVAKRLNITERRVVRLERTGLRRLRTLAKRGGCVPPSEAPSGSQTSTAGAIAPLAASAIRTTSPGGKDSGGGSGSSDKGGGSDSGGGDIPDDSPRNGGIAGVSQTNPPGSVNLTIPLLLLFLGLAAATAIYLLRRWTAGPVPVGGATDEPTEAPRPAWIPWRRSTMDGPGWTSAPPPSREGAGEWAEAPGTEPEPQPEHHDEWIPPSPRRRVH